MSTSSRWVKDCRKCGKTRAGEGSCGEMVRIVCGSYHTRRYNSQATASTRRSEPTLKTLSPGAPVGLANLERYTVCRDNAWCRPFPFQTTHLWRVRGYHFCHIHVPSRHCTNEIVGTVGILCFSERATEEKPSRNVANTHHHVQERGWVSRTVQRHSTNGSWCCTLRELHSQLTIISVS